jgi:ribulose-5-phosphate 4-epimerase/fuculose-1-phosphate aldolase
MNYVSSEARRAAMSDAEWQARVDLAAAHRVAVMHGLNEGIFNHFTLRVPGKSGS